MMLLDNNMIDGHVRTIVAAYLKDSPIKPKDEAVLKAGVELVINLLQNINDIAYCAVTANEKEL